jgi:hypothetical protein
VEAGGTDGSAVGGTGGSAVPNSLAGLEAGLNQPSPNVLHIADGCAAVAQTDGCFVERDGSERGTILVIEP